MARDVADYVAIALVANLTDEDDWFSRSSEEFSGDLDQLRAKAETIVGFKLSEALMRRVIRTLADCSLIRITDDPFSGTFVKVKSRHFPAFVERAKEELAQAKADGDEVSIITKPSDYPNASALAKHELFDDYNELGEQWLRRALGGLRQRVDSGEPLSASPASAEVEIDNAPASNRVVAFTDNQVGEFDLKATEVIEAVAAQNQIDGEPGLRELILGQLRAGRELIRAGSFKVVLLELTLIDTLRFLAKRYEKELIGGLAAALLTALAKQIGIDA